VDAARWTDPEPDPQNRRGRADQTAASLAKRPRRIAGWLDRPRPAHRGDRCGLCGSTEPLAYRRTASQPTCLPYSG
jgi:hypothetical protein